LNGRRIAVTGLGLVSPHGDDPRSAFDALMAGRSAIVPWQHVDTAPAAVASAVFDPAPWFTRLQLAGVDRVSQIAVAAAESARADARWPAALDPARIGVYLGSGMGGAAAQDAGYDALRHGRRVAPLTVVAGMVNAAAAHVAMRASAHGPVYTYSVACASSAVAIAEAAKAIGVGDIDIAIAGGAEALLVPGVVRAWQALQTLAPPDPEDVAASCRPFDETRSGFVLGEGAAMLVLEPLDDARARGATIHAELAGYGISCDAAHLTRPDVSGQVRALTQALRSSALQPAQIGYCNAHGTATRVGDVVECAALRAVWQDRIESLAVSSTKSMHGHLLGAAGALEALITILAIERGEAPPTISTRRPDAACDVPIIRGAGQRINGLEAAISNSFAFGGTNVVLAFRRA
jgi:3-oxoacyl-[acyl-carrier-protein] synthase II